MKKYNYHLPGTMYAYGPIEARNEREARQIVRDFWGFSRLPAGTEFWVKES